MRLTSREVARALGVSEKSVQGWVEDGSLPANRVNNQFRFNAAEVLEWATARGMRVSPQILHEAENADVSLPSVVQALEEGGIHHDVAGGDKEAVLAEVVRLLKLPKDADRKQLLQVLLAREMLGSTAIGEGIAIPHVRNPIVYGVNRPAITLCFLAKSVDFGALDGKPVSILFTMVSPTIRSHLHLLSMLSFMLRDDKFKQVLTTTATRETILDVARQVETALSARAAHKE